MMEWHVLRKERHGFPGAVVGTRGPCQSFAAVVLAVLLLCGGPLFALEENASSGTSHHEVVALTHITPERGMDLLARLHIATVSRVPNTSKLLVTGEQDELRKAVAVLELVDTRTEFDVGVLGSAAMAGALSSNAQIGNAVGGLCVGTFANPPKDKTKLRAILDVHEGNLVVVAPAFQMKDIRLAAQLGAEILTQRNSPVKPAVAATASTISAVAMLEAAVHAPGEMSGKVPLSPGDGSPLGKPGLSPEMQEKLRERYERAREQWARRQAAPQAASVPVSELSEVRSDLSSSQADANEVQPPVATGLVQVGATPDPNLPPESLAIPTAAEPAISSPPGEPAALQPGQTVPANPERITAPSIEPKSMTDPAATKMAPETMGPPSLYEPAAFANGDYVVEVNLPSKLPIIDLLDLVGKYLNLSYIYDPTKVVGDVTVKLNGGLQGRIKVKDLYLLLESALQDRDLVMTRHKGNIVRIIPRLEALTKGDPKLVGLGQTVEAGDAVVTHVFKLKYIDNSSAENLLKAMELTVQVTSISESKSLIVTAYAHRMARIEQLLEMVDRPGAPRKFRYRQLRYTMAKTLAEKVKALAEQLENVSVTIGAAADVPAAAAAQQPGESDAAYRTRLAQIRSAQLQLRAQQAAARGQTPEEPKPGVYLDADERTNRILMIGEEEQLITVDTLVDALDIAQQELRALQLYRMKHVDAEEVARKLQELGVIARVPETTTSQRQSQGQRITGQTPGQPRVTQTGLPETPAQTATELTEEGLVGLPQVVVIESNNSLLVNGTPEQHAKIASIIEYVDSQMEMEEIPYKIYPLENSSPNHLAEILEGLIQETVEQEKDGKIEKTVVSREEKIQIVPDPNTYSLIVYAKKKNQEWIATLIQQLDKRRPQVLIDVTLVEITRNDTFDYDLSLVRGSPDLTSTSKVHGIKPGADSIGKFVQSSGGGFQAFYGDQQIQALLDTMQSKTYGRVLAKPKLLVNDNETGKIETKDTTYVETKSSVPLASTPTAGSQQNYFESSVQFQSYDAGIALDITPHISEGDLLRLNVVLTRSDFDQKSRAANPSKPPDVRTNQVDTAVTLPNGSTVILGGLLKMNQTKGGSKIPILGDIPLVGGLFRSIHNEDDQKKLYIFVKAEIIRPPEMLAGGMKDLERLSERNRMAFERHELEFQSYQDWPGVKPKPVSPPKVLDAQ